jgi:flagellar hook protein FlgE
MMRSLLAGVSGLRNHQVRMDAIGNNVANVNTVGFKASRVTFKEGFSQVLQNANRPTPGQGGTNPVQVGLGMQIGSVDQLFTQGNLETTGNKTDLAIQGDAFFVLNRGQQNYFTRAGNFQLDAMGRLVSATNGFAVQGRMAVNGVMQDGITDIRIPVGQKTAALATSQVTLAGNLNAAAPEFTGVPDATTMADPANAQSYSTATITVFDSVGAKHEVKVLLWKTAPSEWSYQLDPDSVPNPVAGTGTGILRFNPDGTVDLDSSTVNDIEFQPDGADPMNVTFNVGAGVNGLTQFAASSSALLRDQNGYPMGDLLDFSIDRSGRVTGSFSNGTNLTLGQLVLAEFNNPGGLLRSGDNMFSPSSNSGDPMMGFALEGTQSFVTSGALEMSNVDLAQEFTNMIITQRGFQAQGRVISGSDEMLQEVVNLKR